MNNKITKTTGDNLKLLMKELNYSQAKMSEVLEIARNTLNNYLSSNRSIPIEIIIKLKKKFNVNIEWLIMNEGEMFNNENVIPNSDVVIIPYLKEIKASAGFGNINYDENMEMLKIDKKLINVSTNLVGINIIGDSMTPKINHNDIIIVDYKAVDNVKNNQIYIIRINDVLLIKLLRATLEGFDLISLNKEYPPQSIPKLALEDGRAEILGKVILNISSI